mmetsp:Transcript_446/g.1561  ORF Transcript_446/g.1561 Transcript_446/m.1561 type:complete len:204 (+) Transcript_446:4544-5155(+)
MSLNHSYEHFIFSLITFLRRMCRGLRVPIRYTCILSRSQDQGTGLRTKLGIVNATPKKAMPTKRLAGQQGQRQVQLVATKIQGLPRTLCAVKHELSCALGHGKSQSDCQGCDGPRTYSSYSQVVFPPLEEFSYATVEHEAHGETRTETGSAHSHRCPGGHAGKLHGTRAAVVNVASMPPFLSKKPTAGILCLQVPFPAAQELP